jgi:Protein of unknown function (DUF2750)
MAWSPNDQEFEAVLRQSSEKQYRYLINHCADTAEVWGLAVEGADWAMVADASGADLRFAIWPHRRYAGACRQGEWSQREATPIEVHDFVDDLVPRLVAEGVGVAAFPLPDGRFTPVEPRRLRSDLEAELSRME